MSQSNRSTPVHLWIVGVVSLLWHAMACFDYLATMLPIESYMSQFSDAQIEYFHGLPAWFGVFWALAVWAALLGSLALLLKSRWAVASFGVSLLGLIVTSIHSIFLSDGLEIMGTGGAAFSAVIFLVAVLLLVYARKMSARGVLG